MSYVPLDFVRSSDLNGMMIMVDGKSLIMIWC